MSLSKLKSDFRSGGIDKATFIDKAFALHQQLYGYREALADTDIESITIQPDGLVFRTKQGVSFISDVADKRIAPIEILNFDQYEPEITDLFTKLVQPGMVVFDIGANIGWYSLFMAKHIDKLTIHAFEPLPDIYDKLSKNIALNDASQITAHPFGLSSEAGSIELHYNPEYSSQSSMADLGNIETQKVICHLKTMDSFASENQLSPDFIKCDVEGAELLVFKGGKETIAKAKPMIVAEMLRKWAAKFDYHPNDIIALLSELDYSCYGIGETQITPIATVTEETLETNYLFLHKEKHQEVMRQL